MDIIDKIIRSSIFRKIVGDKNEKELKIIKKEASYLLIPFVILILLLLVNQFYFPRSNEPTFPSGVPKHSKLLTYNTPEQKRIEFNHIESVNGYWMGKNVKLIISEPFTSTIEGQSKVKDWGDEISVSYNPGDGSSSKSVEFTPWMTVDLSVGKEHYHKEIKASASLDIVYPLSREEGFFNTKDHLEKHVSFFIISPDEHQMVRKYEDWNHNKNNVLLLIFLDSLIIIILIGIYPLNWKKLSVEKMDENIVVSETSKEETVITEYNFEPVHIRTVADYLKLVGMTVRVWRRESEEIPKGEHFCGKVKNLSDSGDYLILEDVQQEDLREDSDQHHEKFNIPLVEIDMVEVIDRAKALPNKKGD